MWFVTFPINSIWFGKSRAWSNDSEHKQNRSGRSKEEKLPYNNNIFEFFNKAIINPYNGVIVPLRIFMLQEICQSTLKTCKQRGVYSTSSIWFVDILDEKIKKAM